MKKTTTLIVFLLLMSSCAQKENIDNELNIYLRTKPTGINPLNVNNFYQERLARQIFEGLYEYHYLNDPYDAVPLLADGMPQVSDGGLTYIIKIKRGIKFTDDPCFVQSNGKGREITASDVIYSLKHFVTYAPHNKAYFVYYIKGLMEYRERAKDFSRKGGNLDRFIAHHQVEGLKLIDEYTLGIRLRQVFPCFLEALTVLGASVVSKEAVSYYGKDIDWHPVGTGPYMLSGFTGDGEKVTMVKNPNYEHGYYPTDGSKKNQGLGLLDDAGKKLPFLDKINFYFIGDDKVRRVMFDKGEIDIHTPEEDYFYEYFPDGVNLSEKYKHKGDKAFADSNVEFTGILFNMSNAIIGKDTDLRKALALSFDNTKNLSIFNYISPLSAHWVIPPHVYGYDPSYINPYSKHDPAMAEGHMKKSLYALSKGKKELVLLLQKTPALKRMGEFFVESASKIGVNIRLEYANSVDEIKEILDKGEKPVHMFYMSELSTFVCPEKMLRMFFKGKQKYKTDYSGYYNHEYEKLYEKVVLLDAGAEKLKLMDMMRDIVVKDAVFIPLSFPALYRIHHNYVHNYKPHLMSFDRYKYVRIDTKEKKKYLKQK